MQSSARCNAFIGGGVIGGVIGGVKGGDESSGDGVGGEMNGTVDFADEGEVEAADLLNFRKGLTWSCVEVLIYDRVFETG